MNHGIRVVRHHRRRRSSDASGDESVIHFFAADTTSDEEVVASVLCGRLHDDERTAEATKACKVIHVWFPGTIIMGGAGSMLMRADPQCIIRRTAALKKWNGVGEPAAVHCVTTKEST